MPVISMPNPGDAAAGAIGSFLTANTQQQNVQAQLAAAAAAQQFNQQMQTDKFQNLKDQQAQGQQNYQQDFGLREKANTASVNNLDVNTAAAAYKLEHDRLMAPINDAFAKAQLAFQQGTLSTQALEQANWKAKNKAADINNNLLQKYGEAAQQAAIGAQNASSTASYASANASNTRSAYDSAQMSYLPQQQQDAHASSLAGTNHMNSLTAINNQPTDPANVDPVLGDMTKSNNPIMREFAEQNKNYRQQVMIAQQNKNRGLPGPDPNAIKQPISPNDYSSTVQNFGQAVAADSSQLPAITQAINAFPGFGTSQKQRALLYVNAIAKHAGPPPPPSNIQGIQLPNPGQAQTSFGGSQNTGPFSLSTSQ